MIPFLGLRQPQLHKLSETPRKLHSILKQRSLPWELRHGRGFTLQVRITDF